MPLWSNIRQALERRFLPLHLRHGQLGEQTARAFLVHAGLRCLTSNFRCRHGEIDLICRDHDCLVFVEVKTRSRQNWTRPSDAVDRKRQQRLSRAALEYIRRIRQPRVKARFDVIEVLLVDGRVDEIRHLPNAFPLVPPYLCA